LKKQLQKLAEDYVSREGPNARLEVRNFAVRSRKMTTHDLLMELGRIEKEEKLTESERFYLSRVWGSKKLGEIIEYLANISQVFGVRGGKVNHDIPKDL